MANLTYTFSPNDSTELTYSFTLPLLGTGTVNVDLTASASASIDNPCLYPFIATPRNNLTYFFSSGAFIGVSAEGTGEVNGAGLGVATIELSAEGTGEVGLIGTGAVTVDLTASGEGVSLELPLGVGSAIIDSPLGLGTGINELYGAGESTLGITAQGVSSVSPPVTGSGLITLGLTAQGVSSVSPPVTGSGLVLTELLASGTVHQNPSSIASSAITELIGEGTGLSSEKIEGSGSATIELTGSGLGSFVIEGSGSASLELVAEGLAFHAINYGGGTATIDAPFNNGTGIGIVIRSQASKFVRPVFHHPLENTKTTNLTTCAPLSDVNIVQSSVKSANVESDSVSMHVCHTYPIVIIKSTIYCNPLSNSENIYNQECISASSVLTLNSNECFELSGTSNTHMTKCIPLSSVADVNQSRCMPLQNADAVGDIFCSTDIAAFKSISTLCMVQYETMFPLQGVSEFIPPVPIPPGGEDGTGVIGATVVIIEKDTYTVNNIVTIMLENGTPLGIQSMNLSSDANGHSWSCSATLADSEQRDLIRPKEDGSLVTIIVTINDYKWYVLVEKVTTNRSFNQDGISIQCRGLSAELALPYTANTDVDIDQVQTNQQIAEQIIPTGIDEWTIDWQLPVWNVPANTYEHRDLSPISALLQLVTNCGGMLIPHRTDKKFTAKPRYPVLPWNFSTTPPDYEIPDHAIFTITEQPVSKSGANGVYLSGQTNGVRGLVRRDGTSGSELAQTTNNVMMTDADAIRSLGERILSGAQPQPVISSIETWCDRDVVPLFEVGDFIRITVDGDNTEGIVNGISLNCTTNSGVVDVTQRVTIGENTNNQYELFKELLPSNPLSIVTVLFNLGDKSKVQHIDGGTQVVRGSGIVGGSYYLREGQLLNSTSDVPVVAEVVI